MSKGSFFDQNVSIFVGGLHSNVTEEILWELFLQAGPLENVRIPKDKETGKPRSFGFVAYQNACSVPFACELFDTLKLFGRPINCKPQNANGRSPQRSGSINSSPAGLSNEDVQHQQNQHRGFIRSPDPHNTSSPNNRTPSNISRHGLPIVHRSFSTGNAVQPLMHPLLLQSLYQQQLQENAYQSNSGPMRRHDSMYDRRPMTSRTQRREHTHPY